MRELGITNSFVFVLLAHWCWPNRGAGIVSTKPRLKSVHDFLGLMYCFVVSWCVLSCPVALRDIFRTPVARYGLFMLKVPVNTNQLTRCLGKKWATYILTATLATVGQFSYFFTIKFTKDQR